MNTTVLPSSDKRRRRLVSYVSAALIIVVSLVSIHFRHQVPVGSTASLVWALLPVPFLLFSIGVSVWGARSCDELQRKIQFEALAFAYTCVFALLFVVMSLQSAGYWKWFGAAESMMATTLLYPAGLLLARNRYR
jgi:hypothetical protein